MDWGAQSPRRDVSGTQHQGEHKTKPEPGVPHRGGWGRGGTVGGAALSIRYDPGLLQTNFSARSIRQLLVTFDHMAVLMCVSKEGSTRGAVERRSLLSHPRIARTGEGEVQILPHSLRSLLGARGGGARVLALGCTQQSPAFSQAGASQSRWGVGELPGLRPQGVD